MKKILTLLTLVMFTFTLLPFDAEARRMGGGKSIGKQRDSINQQAAPRPTQSQSAAAAPASGAAAAGGASKWGGALAGLAAGGLLAALFMGGAFEGINMADILMLIVLAAVIFFIIRMLRKPRAEQASRPVQFSGMGADRTGSVFTPNSVTPPSVGSGTVAASTGSGSATNSIPADFEVEPFLRNAKLSFIHLQEANGARDAESIRDYTTPEMFAELSAQINESNDPPQKTEIMFIDANLLDVTVTDDIAIASVRFNGQLRESPDAEPESFDEIWHIQKDLKDRNGAWLLAGIQQPS